MQRSGFEKMNDKTKDGLKLGGMISLLVGVISLIVIIPTIARIMKSPQISEYHVKFSTRVAVANFYSGGTLEIDNTIPMNIDNFILEVNDTVKAEYSGSYYTFKTTTKPIGISLASYDFMSASTPYTNFDLGFGLYDFSSYTTITQDQIITPVFTAF